MGGRGRYAKRKKQERQTRQAERAARAALYGTVKGRAVASIKGASRVDMARNISPDALDREEAQGPAADYMYNFFSYSDTGDPVYKADRIADAKTDLLYEVHTLGRGHVTEDVAGSVQMRAASLLAAEEYTDRRVFSSAERRHLQRLADDSTVWNEIDQIRDRRLAGRLGDGRPRVKKKKRFLGAAEYDARERLLDWRRERAA